MTKQKTANIFCYWYIFVLIPILSCSLDWERHTHHFWSTSKTFVLRTLEAYIYHKRRIVRTLIFPILLFPTSQSKVNYFPNKKFRTKHRNCKIYLEKILYFTGRKIVAYTVFLRMVDSKGNFEQLNFLNVKWQAVLWIFSVSGNIHSHFL